MKFLRLFLCLLLVLTLTACGTDPVDPSSSKNDPATPSGSSSQDPGSQNPEDPADPAPADTWFNAAGQYGTVEYTFNQYGMPDKTIFYYASGNVWRTIEHSTLEDNAYSSLLYCQSIYNANGHQLFSLQETRQDKENADYKIPQNVLGHDFFMDKTSCNITYGTHGGVESLTRSSDFRGSQDYAIITWKNSAEIEKITLFYREGSQKATLYAFYEEGKLAYLGIGLDYDDQPNNFYKVEQENGHITRLIHGSGTVDRFSGSVQYFSASSNEEIRLQYDNAGHLTQIDYETNLLREVWNYTYDGDTLTATEYRYGRPSNDLKDFARGYFTFNTDGTFSTADYGGLGSGDASYYVFTYHTNGMISNVKGYDWSPYHLEEGDELDLEWEYSFAEDGSLIEE